MEKRSDATHPAQAVTASAQLTNWSVVNPNYNTGNFNAATGQYTVPESGVYSIQATINYTTTAAVTVSLGAGVNPAFVIRRTAPTATDLITGLFPVLNVNLIALSLRTVLGNGTVTLTGEAELSAGDVIGLFYVANGLTIGINLGGDASSIRWSISRLS